MVSGGMAPRGADDRLGVIAFARMSSRRLPGKALRPLAGRPVLAWVLERLQRVARAGVVVLATSDQPDDDRLAGLAEDAGVALYRGPLDDVAARMRGAMRAFDLRRAVRISADSPFIDPALIDHMADGAATDLVTNVLRRTYPPGCSVEIIDGAALTRSADLAETAADHEHVTSAFYRRPDLFSIRSIEAPDDRYAGLRLTVDTHDDLQRLDILARALGDTAGTADLDAVAAAWRALDLGSQDARIARAVGPNFHAGEGRGRDAH